MTDHNYSVYAEDGRAKSITWYHDDATYSVDHSHRNFDAIYEAIKSGKQEDFILRLFSNRARVNEYFQSTGMNGCHFDGSSVWVYGKVVPTELSRLIIEHVDAKTNPRHLVEFFMKLLGNPSYNSRNQLASFIDRHGLTITPDGNFIAYKGLNGQGKSIHKGPATVNGVHMDGHIPNEVGSVITMPRSEVNDDTTVGCSSGLHAGTWSYANGFGYVTSKVEIDPADVVSVPKDCDEQKLRVCRYRVVEANLNKPTESLVWGEANDTGSSSDSNVIWASSKVWTSA